VHQAGPDGKINRYIPPKTTSAQAGNTARGGAGVEWQEIDEARLLTHWWRNIHQRILVAMDMIVFLLVLTTIVTLSVPLGADSRNLSDRAYDRDSLWSR
jgi:hypothetical protein